MVLTTLAALTLGQAGWIDLFDGKSLTGWEVRGGTATYRVADGAIVGTTAEGSPNTFLCTKRTFDDFELEFEVKVDDALNSGVQIRSRDRKDDGGERSVVYGPQVEIEASPGQAGWIYGEGTSFGWLSPEPNLQDAAKNQHSVFKNGGWNHYRVVAKGVRIRTWINEQPIADLSHDGIFKEHTRGFIGLQVHGIARGTGPFEARWRNLRIRPL